MNKIWDAVYRFLIEHGFTLDKYANSLHLFLSFCLVILFSLGLNVWVSGACVLGIGIIKEVYDWKIKGTVFSFMDLLFDLIGILIGMLFCGAIDVR